MQKVTGKGFDKKQLYAKRLAQEMGVSVIETSCKRYESDYLTSASLEATAWGQVLCRMAWRKTKFPRFVSHRTTKGKDD